LVGVFQDSVLLGGDYTRRDKSALLDLPGGEFSMSCIAI
jgi:hypothetical protein